MTPGHYVDGVRLEDTEDGIGQIARSCGFGTGCVASDRIAEAIQLVVEYDPRPPYGTGSAASDLVVRAI